MIIFFNLLGSYPPSKIHPETSSNDPKSYKFYLLRLGLVRVKK